MPYLFTFKQNAYRGNAWFQGLYNSMCFDFSQNFKSLVGSKRVKEKQNKKNSIGFEEYI